MPRKKEKRNIWRKLALVAFAALFALSGGILLRNRYRSCHEQAANQALAEQFHATEKTLSTDQEDAAAPVVSRKEQLQLLWEQNNDFAGWLSIAETGIDYPVMFTPNEPEYYLRKGFDKSYADSGSLFIGEGCEPEGSNVIIYGHHMNDGTMFGSLLEYADPAYYQAHPTIRFDTLHANAEYEVISAFYSRIYKVDETNVFRYYQYTDLTDPAQFNGYMTQISAAALYPTEATAEYGDRLLTLSTCSYHTKDGRFVVVAAQKR